MSEIPKVSPNDLLGISRIPRLLYPPHIECSILPAERAHSTHIVSIVRELFSRETVFGRVWDFVTRRREVVEVVAFVAVRTAATSEEETTVFDARRVCASEPRVFLDVTSSLGLGFAGTKERGKHPEA